MGEDMTIKEAAAALGLSRYRVWQLVKAGDLPGRLMYGRLWLVDAEAVRRYVRPKPGPRPKEVA